MSQHQLGEEQLLILQRVLGYLNFSSGNSEPSFLQDLSQVYQWVSHNDSDKTTCHELEQLLLTSLEQQLAMN